MGNPDEESKKDDKNSDEEGGSNQDEAGLIDTSALSSGDGTIDEPVTSGSDTPVTSGSDLTVTDEPGKKKPK